VQLWLVAASDGCSDAAVPFRSEHRSDALLTLRHQAGLRDDIRKDRRSIAVTEFTVQHPRSYQPLVALVVASVSHKVSAGSQGKSTRSLRSFVVA
jgi:hypothetical protein